MPCFVLVPILDLIPMLARWTSSYLHLKDVFGFESSVLNVRSLSTGEPHAEAYPHGDDDTLESDALDILLAISPNHCVLSHGDQWVTVVNWRTRKTVDVSENHRTSRTIFH